MHSNHDSIIDNYFFISVACVLSFLKYMLLIMYMDVSLYAGAQGSRKRVSDPTELEAVVNDLPECRTLGMAVLSSLSTPPVPFCGFSTVTASAPGTGERCSQLDL